MYMQVISIEHSLEKPQAELGDEALSPIFHRVSARCPVLHLFGYVHIPLGGGSATGGASAPAVPIEFHHASSSVPENPPGCAVEVMIAAAPHSISRGGSRGGALHLSRFTPLASRRSGTQATGQQDDASPLPKATHAWDVDAHHNIADTAAAVARQRGAPPSHALPVGASHAVESTVGGEGHPPMLSGADLRSSAAQRGCYVQRRACLHVHGVYPSLRLPQYDRNVSAAQLAAQLETVALRVLARQGIFVPSQQLVHNVRIVRRLNLYGYRRHAYAFYEVELIDPDLLPAVADMLQHSTEVGGRQWQLYDAHYRYPSQFMVRWCVNGAAPFRLPSGQCHVRLPTVAELWQNASPLPASLNRAGGLQAARVSRPDGSDAAAQALKDGDEEPHHQAATRSAQQSPLLFRRLWRPDELDRFSTAEVELDVAGADLLDHSSPVEEEEEENRVAGGRRRIVTAGDNLSYTRRIIRRYFREHGVSDDLRVADAIAMERHQQDCVHSTTAMPADGVASWNAEAPAAVMPNSKGTPQPLPRRRYGCVMQMQHGDPTVRWLRHRMLGYLAERRVTTAAAAAAALVASSSATTTNGGDAASISTRLAGTSTVELQEQRAIRQQLVAQYCQPGGSTALTSRHGSRRGVAGAWTTRCYADAHIAVPPPYTRLPDLGSAVAGGDALYVGFSAESLQLSVSQKLTQPPQPQTASALENVATQRSPSSSSHVSPFGEFSPTARAGVAAAPAQDLWKAIAQPSPLSLQSQGSAPATSVAAAAATTPLRSLVSICEAGESGCRDLQSAQEAAHELARSANASLTVAAEAAPAASIVAHAISSWSSWSSALSSSSASLSSGRASSDHDGSLLGSSKDADSPLLRSSATEPPHRTQGEPCPAASEAAAARSDTLTQRLWQSSVKRSLRSSEVRHSDAVLGPLASTNVEALRPSAVASQEDGSFLLGSCARCPASNEMAGAEDNNTPRGRRRRGGISPSALPATTPPARLLACRRWAEGDCVAFVRVRDAASWRLGEVLAVARIASLAAETAELQWLLRLSETHLAMQEQELVRRGSWLRAQLPSARAADTVPLVRDRCAQSAGAAHDVLLGEMVLGNLRDNVPTSSLEGAAGADLVCAAVHSTPMQQLLAEEDAASAGRAVATGKVSVTARQAEPGKRCVLRQQGRRRPSDDAGAVVQAWRVRCFTNVAAYHSVAEAPHSRYRAHVGHPSRSTLPLLQVLCRYAYHVEARVLAAVSPDAFTRGAHMCAANDRPRSSSRRVSSLGGERLKSGEGATHAATARRSSSARASSSRVLFTQPQPLVPLSDTPAPLKGAAASLKRASVSSSVAARSPMIFASAPRREVSEDGGEDTLLFPSSSASAGRSHSGGREVLAQRDRAASACATDSTLLRLTPLPERDPPRGPSHTPNTISPPSALAKLPQDAVDPSAPLVERLWRVLLARQPPPEFLVNGICVVRRVQTIDRTATPAFTLRTQARRRRLGTSWTPDEGGDDAMDAAVEADLSPLGVFSNVSADAGDGGDQGQSIDAVPRDRVTVDVACNGDAVAGAEGRRAAEVVVASAASSLARSSSATLLKQFVVPSLTPTQSLSSSADTVREVTASQRGFLDLLQSSRHLREEPARTVLLQRGGQLGCIVDGMPRCFTVSTSGCGGGLHSQGGSGDMRVSVSAAAWPWSTRTRVEFNDEALASHRYETVPSLPDPRANITGVPKSARATSNAAPTSIGHAPKHHSLSMEGLRKSASHVSGLSLSSSHDPQHYLQCTLRVLYIEVLLHRRPGEALVATSEVLAVGLGQATSATNSAVAVRIFCVAAPRRCAGAVATPHLPATSSSGSVPPLVGLTEAVQVVTVPDEAALLARVRDEILAYDPDLLISWDSFKYGMGHLALRYRAVFQRNLASDVSRVRQHHNYQRPKASGVSHDAAAASAPGGNAGGSSSLAGHSCRSVADDAAARYRSTPRASPLGIPFMFGSGSSGGGGKAVPTQESAQSATTMAAGSSSSSGAASAPSAALSNDFDADDDGVIGGCMNDVSAKGGAPAGQTAEHRGGRIPREAQTGSRWTAQRPLLAQLHAGTDSGAAACQYAKRFGANVHVAGRICTSLGKDVRKEIKMPSYSLPMVHVELLGQPLPCFTDSYLAELFLSPQFTGTLGGGERHTALRYLASRVVAPHRIARKLHWFTKLLELSRMYGILAKEVLTRGSQFRVEATLLRLAQPLGYAMLSPSLSQVHRQPRIECVPLVMQPKSNLYRHDPVVVLDFRSLYPSIITAYNLCYSTCLGVVQPHSHGRLGVLPRFKQSDAALAELLPDDGVVFAPNGAMFVTPSTRVGVLPQMMEAVLDARFEVQAALKHIAIPSGGVVMQQRLQEQQLALKMLANVTYGYTAASYTGRMPCVDLAEAIVSLGRQTLERAIALIHSTPEWRAEVVYGDTDSLFVRLAGRTKADAFRIGKEMADAVTQSNPAPIRLQLEKVLLPCLLLVKKRYAGYMWSSPTQATPTFLAKGIETVRRDQCPATAQLAERLLRLLFDGASATTLRRSYYAVMERLQSGAVNPTQCIFRRAVRLGRYEGPGDAHLPLAARLALQQMEKDVAQTPHWGERLPYVVVRSTTADEKLSDKVVHPERLLHVFDTHSLDATYYIVRHVNSTLDRMFYLVGISFTQWYQAMPRRRAAHSALLNLPTFMAAQQRQQHLQSGVPPDVCGAAASLFFSSGSVSAALSPRSRQVRLGKLTSLMGEHRHHGSSGWLPALCGGGASAAAKGTPTAEEISDGDDQGGEAVQAAELEDLTRPSAQEAIDVDQITTQRSRRPSSSLADAMPRLLNRVLNSGQAGSRSGRRQRWRTVTLDSFYPRTLCVICEEATVSLNDVGRQQAVLMRVGVAGCDATADGRSRPSFLPSSAATEPAAPLPTPLLLPPICTGCWCDPLSLLLHVQQQCRSVDRQMNTLQGLCARCISSGGDVGDTAAEAYNRAIADMEDMDAFCMSSTVTRRFDFSGYAYDGVDGCTPRHVLAAVELSGEGVPRGCVSVDCAVSFEKKWVATQRAQWEAMRALLSRVL
ncbi:hypothetical protein LSCM1_06151 [Leishmania martiniquensis]|uniref:DNA-directed DNA polymerase n=1 Tax=Leishmania martiniquensis TaxID=1580590 RepID=A0A836KMP7_9TRYP|nr:hypothetical protein LSCM1_06151 [Leishmania martiniquensis]